MPILYVTHELEHDEYVMHYVRRAFATMERVEVLPQHIVYRVSGECISTTSEVISPQLVNSRRGPVMLIAIGDDEVSNLN